MRKQVERFVEQAGMLWEEDGFPRIAGRIFGLTLLSEEALSLDELSEALGVSKASISTDTRLLERMGFLERVTKPGDRKDYYQSTERSFERAIAERIRRMHQFLALIDSGRDIAVASPVVRDRLADHQFAFRHITKALETALDGLEDRHRKRARS
jgi:DNA-binding transcriptional regulator GbsR (MarR family)